ncbi:MAG: hypothetical protein ACTHMV_13580 [Chitinophagaceae bacterium]
MAIDVADVKAQFGSYYIKNEINMQRLRSMLYQPVETASLFADRPGSDTIYRGALSQLNRIVQPFQKAYTPIGEIVFKPNQIDLYQIKIDISETPDDLERSYVGFLADKEDLERANWPFVRWLIEEHIIAKKQEDLELNEYFSGVYAAPAPGNAGAAGTAINGIRKQIRDYATAGRTNLTNGPIAMGAPAADPADFCTQVEEFAEAIPPIFRSKLDVICMSKELELRYRRGRRAKYGKEVQFINNQDLSTLEDFQNLKVKGLASMSAAQTNMIWAAMPNIRIRPTKKASLSDTMKMESNRRVVDLFSDWWEVLGFEVPEFIFHNDQDLA